MGLATGEANMKRRPVLSALVLASILLSISSIAHAQPVCFDRPATLLRSGSFQPIASRTFRICPGEDYSSLEREIEQFIAGRNVGARLQNRADGCFDLTVEVLPGAPSRGGISTVVSAGSGSSVVRIGSGSSVVSIGSGSSVVSIGSGSPGYGVSVRIVSQGGASRVTITTTN
jgi:hypothetical protein